MSGGGVEGWGWRNVIKSVHKSASSILATCTDTSTNYSNVRQQLKRSRGIEPDFLASRLLAESLRMRALRTWMNFVDN